MGESARGANYSTMRKAECLFPRRLPEVDLDVEAFSHALRNIVTNSARRSAGYASSFAAAT